MKNFKTNRGITLTEMVASVAIWAIITLIILSVFWWSAKEGKDIEDSADLRQAQLSFQSYLNRLIFLSDLKPLALHGGSRLPVHLFVPYLDRCADLSLRPECKGFVTILTASFSSVDSGFLTAICHLGDGTILIDASIEDFGKVEKISHHQIEVTGFGRLKSLQYVISNSDYVGFINEGYLRTFRLVGNFELFDAKFDPNNKRLQDPLVIDNQDCQKFFRSPDRLYRVRVTPVIVPLTSNNIQQLDSNEMDHYFPKFPALMVKIKLVTIGIMPEKKMAILNCENLQNESCLGTVEETFQFNSPYLLIGFKFRHPSLSQSKTYVIQNQVDCPKCVHMSYDYALPYIAANESVNQLNSMHFSLLKMHFLSELTLETTEYVWKGQFRD
ncbi:MAG: type II secretion system GspH family protein [Bdellovibrionaceae bacterium]|nr:type II secretion system GspH family protein [Pseudobdellovibrionaceae bacterium]MDW8190254.1 type II secretion system protein [Pseudobdellovibrionaceae bacterium]